MSIYGIDIQDFQEIEHSKQYPEASSTQETKFEDFLSQYGKQIYTIQDTLESILSDTWDPVYDPISINTNPKENATIVDICSQLDENLKPTQIKTKKVITIFAHLCEEMSFILNQANKIYYPPLSIFGESIDENLNPQFELKEGQSELFVGKFMNFLVRLTDFVLHIYEVVKNVINQMSRLYTTSNKEYMSIWKSTHFSEVFFLLSKVLVVLHTFDELIVNNELLQSSWGTYRKMINLASSDPVKYNTTEEDIKNLKVLLQVIEKHLFNGTILHSLVNSDFDFHSKMFRKKTYRSFNEETNKKKKEKNIFKEEFFGEIRRIFNLITNNGKDTKLYNKNIISIDNFKGESFVGLSVLYYVYTQIFNDYTQIKMMAKILKIGTNFPCIHLYGSIIFLVDNFFNERLRGIIENIGENYLDMNKESRIEYVIELDRTFSDRVKQHFISVGSWIVEMDSDITEYEDPERVLTMQSDLLIRGLKEANKILNIFKESLFLHQILQRNMKKDLLFVLSRCAEMLIAIRYTFHRKGSMIAETLPFLFQKYVSKISGTLKKLNDPRLAVHIQFTLQLATQCLKGPPTSQRIKILLIILNILSGDESEIMKDKALSAIISTLRKLIILGDLQQKIWTNTDMSFHYFSNDLFERYLRNLFRDPINPERLQYLLHAFGDCGRLLQTVEHLEEKDQLKDRYIQIVMKLINSSIIKPLCIKIETDLRYHAHSHLEVKEKNILKKKGKITDYSLLLNLSTLRFFDITIKIKQEIKQYLDRTFYDISTVALSDWKKYDEMRNLAKQKYGIEMTDVYLPSTTQKSGLDVLQIMRNIQYFVSKFNYNLNNQIFVERMSNLKHINAIGIGVIANSIKTHGIGIINTTVHVTFQFLKQMFRVFSGFLKDDYIKSLLIIESEWFSKNIHKNRKTYEFSKSKDLIHKISKLGSRDMNYLSKFRETITQIGNAMAYVRMVRAGGIHFISDSVRFIPDITETVLFGEASEQLELSETTIEAGKNMDQMIKNLTQVISEGSDYFASLVKVFAKEFRTKKNAHMETFYIIVPALQINFIENMIISKAKIGNQGEGGAFSDDGFVIGIAYILKILGQFDKYDSLRWFEIARNNYQTELNRLTTEFNKKKGKSKFKGEIPTLTFSIQKNQNFIKEFQLLNFSLNSAKILFEDSDLDDELNKEKEEKMEKEKENENDEKKSENKEAEKIENESSTSTDQN
ncbi:wash complex subunit 4 [Anaeramoeba flamelloides]|uniref:Wash complex subunit 4 n=1 Tax=Anaeramoeba flamelloides TaxID=1746091 RepID=A0ABQ8Y028_9EUKA|nr:wash complex subunit 4 [Anaeramoeba flamelloides]